MGAMKSLSHDQNGRYYEDFAVGDVYRCRYGRTITEAENIQFTLQTNNSNQIHFNRDYGRRTDWGRCLVNSLLTLSVVIGMSVRDVSENGFALGWDEIELPNPVYPGDTLYSESEILFKRESKSDSRRGIVKVATRGYNQDGALVLSSIRSVMVWKRQHAPSRDVFPTV